MADGFDPYRKWLGIPLEEQPPNHYRLLGIPIFDDDPDVIENAADRQMAHVRTYQTGKHADLSQKLLNEISNAKVCLLNPDKKATYDAGLTKKLSATEKPKAKAAAKPAPKPAEREATEAFSFTPRTPVRPVSVADKKERLSWQHPAVIGGIAGGVLLLLVLIVVIATRNGSSPEVTDFDGGDEDERVVKEDDTVSYETPVDVPPHGGNPPQTGPNGNQTEGHEEPPVQDMVLTPIGDSTLPPGPTPVAGNAKDRSDSATPPFAIAPFDADTAKQHQKAWAEYLGLPRERDVDLPGGAKMSFVLIPPGEFMMGSTAEEQARFVKEAKAINDDWGINRIRSEGPQHRVRIMRPFYLGKYEMSQTEWVALLGDNPANFKDDPSHPVELVSFDEVQGLLTKLNQVTQQQRMTFVLPTEAQWEYACRAGTTTAWHCSEAGLGEYGWFNRNSGGKTHPVGQLRPNAFGLYDMHGNVWEFCGDRYAPDYYMHSPANDPGGPPTGTHRVMRGGAWYGPAAGYCRSAHRAHRRQAQRFNDLGFRLTMTVPDDGRSFSTGTTEADRVAAEWVLGIGGTIETDTGRVTDVGQLAQQPFRIVKVRLASNQQVTDDDLKRLIDLTRLTSLDLQRTTVSDAGLEHLKGLTSLTYLLLNGTPVSDAGLRHLNELTNLAVLNLTETQVSDSGLEHLRGMTKLTSLELPGTKVGDTGLVHLKVLTNLTSLQLHKTQVSDSGLEHLRGMTKLSRLYLHQTRVTAQGIADLKKALPNCNIKGP